MHRNKVFRIYPFLDLRTLRRLYLKNKVGLVEVDSTDNPSTEKAEEDFGLHRSTTAAAIFFLRQCQAAQEGDEMDELTEFLNDE